MPSQANIKQSLIVAMAKGLCVALEKMGEADPVFAGCHERITKAVFALGAILKGEPGGDMTMEQVEKVVEQFESFRRMANVDAMEDARAPVSMLIGLVGDQLAYVRHTRKRALLLELQHELENMIWLYDPAGVYDSAEGLDAAEAFYAAMPQ